MPKQVRGENYAAAAKEFTEAVEYWVGVVRTAAKGDAKACNHCGGHGYVGGDVFTEFDVPMGVWS